MGTAAYMSPEQARGKPVDRRADIWAYGVVLFEALTGRRLFEEETVSDTLAAVLRADIPWNTLPRELPTSVRRLLRRCLERDPKTRLQHVGDARLELAEHEDELPLGADASRPRLAYLAIAFVAGMAVLAVATRSMSPSPPRPSVVEFDITRPEGVTNFGSAAVSPDGTTIAFRGIEGGVGYLYLRSLDAQEPTVIDNVGRVNGLFWSPDGTRVGFMQDGAVKVVQLDRGGEPQTLCRLPEGGGASTGTWSQNGTILFGSGYQIHRVSASGGEPIQIAPPEGHVQARNPVFLPDGIHFLFWAQREGDGGLGSIFVGNIDGGEPRRLMERSFRPQAVFYAFGRLVLADQYGALLAFPMDSDSLEIVGEPKLLRSETNVMGWTAGGHVLVLRKSPGQGTGQELELVGRDGSLITKVAEPADYYGPRLSPDETRVAVEVHRGTGGGDIEIFTIGEERHERVTFAPDRHNALISWSPDGGQIAFHSVQLIEGHPELRVKAASGASDVRALGGFETVTSPTDWSSDGSYLLIDETTADQGWNIWTLAMREGNEPEPFLVTEHNEMQGVFSPDGAFVAYASDESRQFEIFLRPFPPTGDVRWQLTTEGGEAPRWRGDGQELYYLAPGNRIMALSVTLGDRPQWSAPVELFQRDVAVGAGATRDFPPYDVTADGERFLLNASGQGSGSDYTVIVNWAELLNDVSR